MLDIFSKQSNYLSSLPLSSERASHRSPSCQKFSGRQCHLETKEILSQRFQIFLLERLAVFPQYNAPSLGLTIKRGYAEWKGDKRTTSGQKKGRKKRDRNDTCGLPS